MNAWTRIILLTVCAGGLALELTPNNALVPDASPGPLVECGESGCCPKSCSGHGECVDGTCKCHPGSLNRFFYTIRIESRKHRKVTRSGPDSSRLTQCPFHVSTLASQFEQW